MNEARDIARAVDSLRRGWPILIDGTAFLAVETADEEGLRAFDEAGPAHLLISGNRAATLKITNQIEAATSAPVHIERTSSTGVAEAVAIADPARDLRNPLKGPFRALPSLNPAASLAAVRLARRAGLLPALFAAGRGGDGAASVSAGAVERFDRCPDLRIAARAKLPTDAAEKGEIVAFRSVGDAAEHVALLIGAPDGRPPLVRLHSECLTGDVLGSLKCDCGPQLAGALAAMSDAGWGILLYLRQEGRGIGLVNKVRAYSLQDQGFDTVDANLRLGFGDDERDFSVAARMLELLGQKEVRLLTNNPRKVAGLEGAGIRVAEQVPLQTGANVHNQAYLSTKRLKSGHLL